MNESWLLDLFGHMPLYLMNAIRMSKTIYGNDTQSPQKLFIQYIVCYMRLRMRRVIYWIACPWPWPKVTTVALFNKKCLSARQRHVHPITTHPGSYITLALFITWIYFGGIPLETSYSANLFFFNCGCAFSSKSEQSIYHMLGMVSRIDLTRKGNPSAVFWVNYVISTFDLTHD